MKTHGAYAAGGTLAAGFSAYVFLFLWAGALPDIFARPTLTAGWVPCSVFLGIVLGCLYFGRRALLVGSATRMFSLTLFAFGVVGVPVLQLLQVTGRLPDALLGAGITSAGALTVILAAITLCILFIPGFLLGGVITFGALSNGRPRERATFPLWSLFTGLAAGSLILVFGLLPHLTVLWCAAVAAIAAAAAGLAGLLGPGGAQAAGPRPDPVPAREPGSDSAGGAVLGTIYIFAAAAWAILWVRVVLLATGPSLQALNASLVALFAGLAAGCALVRLPVLRQTRPRAGMGIAAGATAVLMLYLTRSAASLPMLFLDAAGDLPLVWADLLTGYFALAFLTLFAPGLLLGIFLQLASRATGPGGVDSVGAVPARFVLAGLAAWLASRFLPTEAIPLKSLLLTLPWIAAAVSVVILVANRPTRAGRLATASVIAIAVIVLSLTQPRWAPSMLSRGLYTLPLEFKQMSNLKAVLAGPDRLLQQDDPCGMVSVDRTPDAMTLRIGGSVRASAESGMVPHLLAGHIPMLLHPEPHKIFLDGLGGGLTLGTILAYGPEEVHCAEPSSGAVRAAGLFSLYNGDAARDPRLRLHAASAANHLLLTDNRYDVIVLGSPPPYSPTSAARMTTDFFSLARSRLAAGGIICRHVSMFELTTGTFKSLAKSFAYYFPHVSVWWAGGDDVLLLGGTKPFVFPEEAIRTRMAMPEVEKDLNRLGTSDPYGILSCFVMRRDKLMALCGGADLLTADSYMAALEWPARSLHLVRTQGLRELASASEKPTVLLPGLDRESTEYKILRDRLDRCLEARDFAVRSLVAMREGKLREAASLVGESTALCPLNGVFLHGLADYLMVLSKSLLNGGRTGEAVEAARRAVELVPGSPRAYYNLASIEFNRDPGTARALLERAVTLNPYYVPAYLLQAQAELAMGEAKGAAETVGRVLPMEPFNVDAHHIRGLSFIQRRMYAEGRAELELVLEAEPENTEAIDALAYSWLLEDDLERAEKIYKRLLEVDPDHLGALNNYATVLAEKGRFREAIAIWTRALEISPGNKNIIDNIEDARRSMRQE